MNNVSLKINEEQKKKIIEFYRDFVCDVNEQYVVFMAKFEKIVIKIYQNNKGEYTATFSGPNALNEALIFDKDAKVNETTPIEWINLDDQIGSDEVGVGDLFGPTIVAACYVKKNDIEFLRSLHVGDSKKISDEKIREIAPKLCERLVSATLTMSNKKLNASLESGYKKLCLEAKMHNQAQLIVKNKIDKNVNVYLDQFLPPQTYIKYLTGDDIITNLHFKTKGESYYPSIAAASIIARYKFLLYMDELNQKYGVKFPLGAGKEVDTFLEEFQKNHTLMEIKDLVKAHFVNYKKIATTGDKLV